MAAFVTTRRAARWVCAAALALCCVLCAADDYEPDDTPQAARWIGDASGSQQAHAFDELGDEDWVKFYAPAGLSLEVQTDNLGPNCDTYVELYRADAETLIDENDDVAAQELRSRLLWTIDTTALYYLRVMYSPAVPAQSGAGTEYDLIVWWQNAPAVPGGVIGSVFDDATGAPIASATVRETTAEEEATTDDAGVYFLGGLQQSVYDLAFSAPGYVPAEIPGVLVEGGWYAYLDVRLSADVQYHSADQNQDAAIALSELLRVIQLYNSDGFHCDATTEDGYAVGTGDTACTPHASDYTPQDWSINISELLRLIQLFNSGGYQACPGSEDGFCPGAA